MRSSALLLLLVQICTGGYVLLTLRVDTLTAGGIGFDFELNQEVSFIVSFKEIILANFPNRRCFHEKLTVFQNSQVWNKNVELTTRSIQQTIRKGEPMHFNILLDAWEEDTGNVCTFNTGIIWDDDNRQSVIKTESINPDNQWRTFTHVSTPNYGVGISAKAQYIQPTCGNNIEEWTEGCDDGNTRSGDGCSYNCMVELITLAPTPLPPTTVPPTIAPTERPTTVMPTPALSALLVLDTCPENPAVLRAVIAVLLELESKNVVIFDDTCTYGFKRASDTVNIAFELTNPIPKLIELVRHGQAQELTDFGVVWATATGFTMPETTLPPMITPPPTVGPTASPTDSPTDAPVNPTEESIATTIAPTEVTEQPSEAATDGPTTTAAPVPEQTTEGPTEQPSVIASSNNNSDDGGSSSLGLTLAVVIVIIIAIVIVTIVIAILVYRYKRKSQNAGPEIAGATAGAHKMGEMMTRGSESYTDEEEQTPAETEVYAPYGTNLLEDATVSGAESTPGEALKSSNASGVSLKDSGIPSKGEMPM